MLNDSFGRTITYLRVSVTDRCNLRCVYCMPSEGMRWLPRAQILTFDEIDAVVRVAASLGIMRVRLTGGEPLVRPNLANLVQRLKSAPGIEEVSLTTNGMLLEGQADELALAGLDRVNVSLDTLQARKFARITRGGDFDRVLRGIERAEEVGLTPIKLNCVVVRDVNDDELIDLACLTYERAWHVRFIECLPIGNQGDWGTGFPGEQARHFSVFEMMDRLAPLGLAPIGNRIGEGPARSYGLHGARGTIGFIAPLGDHFCGACNRMRLTADGRLRACLLHPLELHLREALRRGEPIEKIFRQAAAHKPEKHDLAPTSFITKLERRMCQIGG